MSAVGITAANLKLLPIAGTWAAPFALYNITLSMRIVSQRMKYEIYAGDRLPESKTKPPSTKTPDPLFTTCAIHRNFLENIPLAFILLIIAESNGGSRKFLNYTMGTR